MFEAIQSNSFLSIKIFATSGTLMMITLDASPACGGTAISEKDKKRATAPKNVRILPFFIGDTSPAYRSGYRTSGSIGQSDVSPTNNNVLVEAKSQKEVPPSGRC
jgi:hypothetical protein